MRPLINTVRRALIAAGLAGILLGGLPSNAAATTGPSVILPPSRYKVRPAVAKLYVGAYELSSVAQAARISASALGIELSGGTLRGLAQFYGYDTAGQQTLWVDTLYNFHLTAKGVMIIDLLAPGGHALLGRLFVTRSRRGDLRGQIRISQARYAIGWHRVATTWTPTKG